jgi:hypothetical protein
LLRRVLIAVLLSGFVGAGPVWAQEAGEEAPPAEAAQEGAVDDRPRWAKEPWEKVRFGVKAGASFANLRGELPIPDVGVFPFRGDWGFAAGLAFEIPINLKLSLQPELLVIRKHAQIDLGNNAYTGSEKLSVNYFEVPLLLKWYPGSRRGVVASLQAGPTVSVRMDALRESRKPNGAIEDIEGKTLVRATDWGLTFGGGFEFHEFIWALTLDVRYVYGLTSIDNSGSGLDARWGAAYIMAGVTW